MLKANLGEGVKLITLYIQIKKKREKRKEKKKKNKKAQNFFTYTENLSTLQPGNNHSI